MRWSRPVRPRPIPAKRDHAQLLQQPASVRAVLDPVRQAERLTAAPPGPRRTSRTRSVPVTTTADDRLPVRDGPERNGAAGPAAEAKALRESRLRRDRRSERWMDTLAFQALSGFEAPIIDWSKLSGWRCGRAGMGSGVERRGDDDDRSPRLRSAARVPPDAPPLVSRWRRKKLPRLEGVCLPHGRSRSGAISGGRLLHLGRRRPRLVGSTCGRHEAAGRLKPIEKAGRTPGRGMRAAGLSPRRFQARAARAERRICSGGWGPIRRAAHLHDGRHGGFVGRKTRACGDASCHMRA